MDEAEALLLPFEADSELLPVDPGGALVTPEAEGGLVPPAAGGVLLEALPPVPAAGAGFGFMNKIELLAEDPLVKIDMV